MNPHDPAQARPFGHNVPFREALGVWGRIAALSFGGPAGQIAVMHRILVDEKRWVGEQRFLGALNYCMLLPGPEAIQLAIYIGWLMHGLKGGLVAGIFFLLPGFVAILALSLIYVAFGEVTVVQGLFFGLKAAVLAIVLQAVFRIGSRALTNWAKRGIAAAAFLGIFVFGVPFPLIILAAGLVGFLAARGGSDLFRGGGHGGDAKGLADRDSVLGEATPDHARVDAGWAGRIGTVLLALWLCPVAALMAVLGPGNVFAEVAAFFSVMAVVTFGGAYAVLAYVAQEAVQNYGWLAPGEMIDGLGMAETTPGPLVQVVQFVGFMGAFRAPGALDPYFAGVLAAVLTTWVTFLPCFLFIFVGAPFAERLRHEPAVAGALSAITAAVVGVILNLAVWFGLHVVFAAHLRVTTGPLDLEVPVPGSLDPVALLFSAVAILAVFWLRAGVFSVLGGAAAAGILWALAAGV